MARTKNDVYANMATAQVTGADGSIVFAELLTGISIGQGIGILIDSVDYYYMSAKVLLADGKTAKLAWVTSNALTSISIDDRRIIHYNESGRVDHGTAGNSQIVVQPDTYDFSPPIIVAAPRLYLAVELPASSGATGEVFRARFRFRYVDLTDKEYLEIAETFILVG